MEASPMSSQEDLKSSARREPLMRLRTDGKLMSSGWPALRISNTRADRATVAENMASSEEASPTTKSSSFGLRSMLPGANWSAKRRDALQSKRKPSVSDVGSSPMTTVQEMCLDSPTIPGHLPGRPLHPGIERSLSVPDHVLNRLSEEVNDRTPRASEFPPLGDVAAAPCITQPDPILVETEKRPSLSLSKDLTPLIIPNVAEPEHDIEATIELPPEVPPKSPRTESRASPRIQRTPHSANSSVSTLHSATSSSSSNSFNEHRSAWALQNPTRTEIPPNHLRGMENVVPGTNSSTRAACFPSHSRSLENITPRTPATPWMRNGRSQSPSVSPASLSRKHSRSPTKSKKQKMSDLNLSTSHQRERSDPQSINRKCQASASRRDTTSIHGLMSRIDNIPEYYSENFDLPSGLRAIDAHRQFSEIEAKALKKQATRHAESFEILQTKDVSMLSQELELLDERCAYLQSTHRSLRQGRRNLHTRMITYLRSPRMANFSRESILKQEEALAELDVSIDDWVAKLEAAEERRTTIRQKLLQHIAAALTLQTTGISRPAYSEEATPPVSPEKADEYFTSKRKDVQSIKIYAGEGVTALLAEIEREIGFIADNDQVV